MTRPHTILLGAGGHARVVRAMAEALGMQLFGVCDPTLTPGQSWSGLPVLGGDEALLALDPADVLLLNGLGKLPGNAMRARLQAEWTARGFTFPKLVHPAAWVAPDVLLAEGVQVMAGAVVQPGCVLGPGCIVNTSASLDHDGLLGADVHLAPGARLCGNVQAGAGVFIGAGAIVIQGIRIGSDAVVAAGAVLTRDLGPGQMALRPGMDGSGPGSSGEGP